MIVFQEIANVLVQYVYQIKWNELEQYKPDHIINAESSIHCSELGAVLELVRSSDEKL